MSDLELLADTLHTVVGLDEKYYRPSHLLRGRAERALGECYVDGNPVQSKKTPRERFLSGDDVSVPIIKGPFGEGNRDCDGKHSFFLLVANTYKKDLEREIQMLFEIGVPFNEETCSDVFKEAFVIEVFAHSDMGTSCQPEGKARFIIHRERPISIEKKFSLILNILNTGQNKSGIRGWVHIKQPFPKTA